MNPLPDGSPLVLDGRPNLNAVRHISASGPRLTRRLTAYSAVLCALLMPIRTACAQPCPPSASLLPADQLIYKGTHNSYSCFFGGNIVSGNTSFAKNHPPDAQIDDFGVWSVELDFNVVKSAADAIRLCKGTFSTRTAKQQLAIVGHDGPPGSGSTTVIPWGCYLYEYLTRIANTQSVGGSRQRGVQKSFRPIFIKLEKKCWLKANWDGVADGNYDPPASFLPLVEEYLEDIFGRDRIFGPQDLARLHNIWPTIPKLAGKVIASWYYTNDPPCFGAPEGGCRVACPDYISNCDPSCRGNANRNCCGSDLIFKVNPFRLDNLEGCGEQRLDRVLALIADGSRLLMPDLYMQDWTFEYGVPPNPIVVDTSAAASSMVADEYWYKCSNTHCCDPDGCPYPAPTCFSCSTVVAPHGTFRFPYASLGAAVTRARGSGLNAPNTSCRQGGYGWTVLLGAGSYRETEPVTIDFPLTLTAQGGPATIEVR